jgi:uncharacterized membrane protein
MAWPIIVAWLHYVSIMLMVASLLGEHLLLKPEMDVAQARTLQRLDIVYGASATVVLVTGLLRMFLEKGPAYYNHHIAFHILFGLFVIAALLSIYPTIVFLRWRGYKSRARAAVGSSPVQEDPDDRAGGNDVAAAGAVFCDLDGARRVLSARLVRSRRSRWAAFRHRANPVRRRASARRLPSACSADSSGDRAPFPPGADNFQRFRGSDRIVSWPPPTALGRWWPVGGQPDGRSNVGKLQVPVNTDETAIGHLTCIRCSR